MDAGVAEIRLPLREEFLRQDGSDWLHGGIVAALIDIAGNAAVRSVVGVELPTIDMRVDYLRPSKGNLIAVANVVKIGRSFATADIEVRDQTMALAAIGRAIYAVQHKTAGE